MRENAERFDGLAETYAAFRPGYPAQAFRTIAADVTSPLKRALDVGAGPGNSTLSLREALGPGWTITAAEPGRDMRRVLRRRFEGTPGLMVLDACAEALPLPGAFASLGAICAAWPWVDPERTMAEMARVLVPGGVLAVVRNRRQPLPVIVALDGYLADHGSSGAGHFCRERRKLPTQSFLEGFRGFARARSGRWPWRSQTDCRGLIDLWLTRSTAWEIVRRIGLDRVMRDLTEICRLHHPDGHVTLEWETRATWVRRV